MYKFSINPIIYIVDHGHYYVDALAQMKRPRSLNDRPFSADTEIETSRRHVLTGCFFSLDVYLD